MIELTPEQVIEYFQRSFSAVDGLWCMKVEDKYGFDVALDIDNEVWKVFPKIQARKLKELAQKGDGIDSLFECFTAKLDMEGQSYKAEKIGDDGSFRIIIDDCSWHNAMVRSGREALSPRVGSLICTTEYSVWASEFGDDIKFQNTCRICEGANCCVLEFIKTFPA